MSTNNTINPFLISGYESPDFFCDRVSETNTLVSALENGRNITLISPRKLGKTGLISNVFYNIKKQQPQIYTFYLDIYSTRNLKEFVNNLAHAILGAFDSNWQKRWEQISKYVKNIRPTVTFDDFTGKPKFSVEITHNKEETTLIEIFDYLKNSNTTCWIAIDEFQQISEYPEKGTEALLRSHIQFLPNVRFIFSGSKQHIMQEMFYSAKRPFYQSTQILSLQPIAKNEYFTFANHFFSKQGTSLSNELFNEIYDLFDGHTWYIQMVLNRLYSCRNNIDKDLVVSIVNNIVDESAYYYQFVLNTLPTGAIRLLKAIAKERIVTEPNAGEFIQKYQLVAASSVNAALKTLLKNELVYQTPDGYIIYDRFMSLYLK